MGLALSGLVLGSCIVFVAHVVNPTWFQKVCTSDSLLLLLGVDGRLDLGVGSDGFKAPHLGHDNLTLSSLLHYRIRHVGLRTW